MGSSVKKVVKKVTKPIKKVAKSDVGKAALAAAGLYYLGGGALGPFQRAGFQKFALTNIPVVGKPTAGFLSGLGLRGPVANEAIASVAPKSFGLGQFLSRGSAFRNIAGISALSGLLAAKDQKSEEEIANMSTEERNEYVAKLRAAYTANLSRGFPGIGSVPYTMAAEGGIMMASSMGDEGDEISMRMFGKPVKDLNEFELIDFYEELQRLQEKFRGAQGGRVGLAEGSGGFESFKDFIENTGDEELMDMYIDVLKGIKSEEALFKLLRKKGYQTYAVGGRVDYAEGSKDKSGIMMASAPDTMDSLNDLAQMLFGKNLDQLTDDERDALDDYNQGLAKGGMPTGIMRTNAAGIKERDYRETGGFVPVGIKEKADDVPAMLSKNEFVMTADAVRGAGNGSIEKGAQKMYDTMKELENRVA